MDTAEYFRKALPPSSGCSAVPPKCPAAAKPDSRSLRLPPAPSVQAPGWSSQVGVRRAFYSSRVQKRKGDTKEIKKERGKGGKKRISRLGPAETCNVKHHWCQLRNLRPGLSPIHKSRRLGPLAGPMWIESGVVAGPPAAGGGRLSCGAACKAQTRLGPAGERGGAGLA